MGAVAQMDGLERAPSFSLALGRLDPASFHLVWNVWPLATSLIWMQLQNLDIKNEHHRQLMAKAASSAAPHI